MELILTVQHFGGLFRFGEDLFMILGKVVFFMYDFVSTFQSLMSLQSSLGMWIPAESLSCVNGCV